MKIAHASRQIYGLIKKRAMLIQQRHMINLNAVCMVSMEQGCRRVKISSKSRQVFLWIDHIRLHPDKKNRGKEERKNKELISVHWCVLPWMWLHESTGAMECALKPFQEAFIVHLVDSGSTSNRFIQCTKKKCLPLPNNEYKWFGAANDNHELLAMLARENALLIG